MTPRFFPILLLCFGMAVAAAGAAEHEQGIDLYNRSQYAEAQSALEKAVNNEPNNAQAQLYMGLTLIARDQVDAAEPYLKKADELQSSDDTQAGLAVHAIAKRDLDRAESLLSGKQGDLATYARGLLHVHRKQNEQGAQLLEQYIEKYPSSAYAHYYAGLAYSGMRKNDRMLMHFERFLALHPDAPEARKVRSLLRVVQ